MRHKFNKHASLGEQLSQLYNYLLCNGTTASSTARKFFSTKGNTLGAAGSDVSWIKYWYPGQMSEEHIISAGMAEMKYSDDVVLVPLEKAARIVICCRQYISNVPIRGSETIDEIKVYVKDEFKKSMKTTMLLPVCWSSHWGVVVILQESALAGSIYWGDSLRHIPPPGLLNGIRKVLVEVFENAEWIIKDENCSLDILKYPRQNDAFSCGFYMLSTMGAFVKSTGCLPCFCKEGGSFIVDDLPVKVQDMRIGCIKAFLASVDEIGKTLVCFSDIHVLRHLHKKIISRGNIPSDIFVENACISHATEEEVAKATVLHDDSINTISSTSDALPSIVLNELNDGLQHKPTQVSTITCDTQKRLLPSLKKYGSQEHLIMVRRNVSDLVPLHTSLLVRGERFSSSYYDRWLKHEDNCYIRTKQYYCKYTEKAGKSKKKVSVHFTSKDEARWSLGCVASGDALPSFEMLASPATSANK